MSGHDIELESMIKGGGGGESSSRSPAASPNPNRRTGGFTSPAVSIATFLFAAAQNEVAMLQNLIDEETVKVNDCDYDKRTALHVASAEGHIEAVRALLREGADINFADRYKSTPLDDAIHHGHTEVAKLLLEHGAKHGTGSNFGLDLVHAAGQGDLNSVRKFVENGIPVNSADYDLRTPLHVAISGRHYEVVKFLLEHGASLTVEDRYGGTPLEEAHRGGVRLGEDPILDLVSGSSGSKEHASWSTSLGNPFVITFLTIEIIIGILFAIFSEYGPNATAGADLEEGVAQITQRQPFFMDVHIMIFMGFGFLMTFLRKYGYTAVGLTFIIGSLSIQVYQLFGTFWENIILNEGPHWHKVEINVLTLIKGDFAAGAVLISFGALLGKISFTQMLFLTIFEVFFFSLNEAVSLKLAIADIGGSMVIHMFGAFFGLAASRVLTPLSARGNRDNSAVYHSDIFSMIGTLFLWVFWPSFNGALSEGNAQHRATVNTVLSLTASCVFAFIFSQFWRKERVFNMVDIQNATLAGGVAMGSCADMALHPGFALLVGAVSGTISVFGFAVLQGFLERTIGLHDTCGVLNLHGIPGLIGGVASAIVTASFGSGNDYNLSQLYLIYPDRRSHGAQTQAKLQTAFIFITLAISICTGIISSFIIFFMPYPKKFFVDSTSWETPSREIPYFFDKRGEARHSSEKPATETPAIATVPAANAANISEKTLDDLQNKISYLETAMRSARKTLREQARALEGMGGRNPALRPEDSQMLSPTFGNILGRSDTMESVRPAPGSNAALMSVIENLSRQVSQLVEQNKKK